LNLLQFASDPDANDVLHVANLSDLVAGVTLDGDTLHVDPNAYNSLAVGEHETINLGYDIIDGHGGSVPQTATVTIYGENDKPTIIGADSVFSRTINELPNVTGSAALDTVSGAIAFTDVDLSDRPTASVDTAHQTVSYHDSSGHT